MLAENSAAIAATNRMLAKMNAYIFDQSAKLVTREQVDKEANIIEHTPLNDPAAKSVTQDQVDKEVNITEHTPPLSDPASPVKSVT